MQKVANDDFIEYAEMLLALNPNDNHGIREHLSCAYLMRGRPDKIIELTERYPSDFCGPALNGILALVTVGREAEARDELLVAMEEDAVALRMLLAETPRKPKADESFGIAIGGQQEPWLYRMSAHVRWERDGALAWLNQTWPTSRQ